MTQVPPTDIFARRVCLQLDGMDAVSVRRDIAYGPPDRRLCMDVYYPSDEPDEGRWPAVFIVAGYPRAMDPPPTTLSYKEIGWTVNHAEGPHAFDLFDNSRTSRDILRQTLRFLRQHLTAEVGRKRHP